MRAGFCICSLSSYTALSISAWRLTGDFVCLISDPYNFDLSKGHNKGRCSSFKNYKAFAATEKARLVLYIFHTAQNIFLELKVLILAMISDLVTCYHISLRYCLHCFVFPRKKERSFFNTAFFIVPQ